MYPPRMKAGVGAVIRTASNRNETQMETDEPILQSQSPIERHHVPAPSAAKLKDYISPSQADEAGMRKWKDDMLCQHPGGHATSFEQWGNSYVTQSKTVIDTMTQLLRIKEDAYSNMFNERAKKITETNQTFETSKHELDEAKAYADK